MAMTQVERIAALEVQVAYVRAEQAEISMKQAEISRKLDDLLSMRDKGIGAFWLASALFGTSVLGVVAIFVSWLKG